MLLPNLSGGVMRTQSEVPVLPGARPSQAVSCVLPYSCNGVPETPMNAVSGDLNSCCAMAAQMAHNSCMAPMNTCSLGSCSQAFHP
jgi:hypothetical protein